MTAKEWFWDGPGEERIFTRSWSAGKPRGQIIVVHGLGEHSGRYEDLAAYMVRLGWQVLALDLPGHGKTATRPGYVRNWDVLVEALETLLLRCRIPDLPIYLYGHSMGAALSLQVAIRKRRNLQGVVASAPPMLIAQSVPAWKPVLARLAGPLLPGLRFDNGIDASCLSRDKRVVEEYLRDPLVNSKVSPGLGLGLMNIGPWLVERAGELDIPTLLMHGDADSVADISGSREFCRHAGEICQMIEFPGFYHELHHDIGWRQVAASAAAWLDEKGLGNKGANAANQV